MYLLVFLLPRWVLRRHTCLLFTVRGGAFVCLAFGRPLAPRAAACPAPFPLNHSPSHFRAIAQGTYSTGGASSCTSCAAVRLHAQRVVALSLPAQQLAPPPFTLTILPRTSAPLRRARTTQARAAPAKTSALLAPSESLTQTPAKPRPTRASSALVAPPPMLLRPRTLVSA
jgi:hypothetical protein